MGLGKAMSIVIITRRKGRRSGARYSLLKVGAMRGTENP